MLEQVLLALGGHEAHERWILPYREKGAEVSVLGLAAPGTITVSPLTKAEVIIHECLHRCPMGQEWSEDTIEKATTYLYRRLDDSTARRIVDIWDAKAKKIKRPIASD